MQFPNPIIRSLILYDNNGNAVIVLGPGPIIKVINPSTNAELDIDAGSSFPTITFFNSAHTKTGTLSLATDTAISTQQFLLMTSPTYTSFVSTQLSPRLYLGDSIVLGAYLTGSSPTKFVGGQITLSESLGAMTVWNEPGTKALAQMSLSASSNGGGSAFIQVDPGPSIPSGGNNFPGAYVTADDGGYGFLYYWPDSYTWLALQYQNGWTDLGGGFGPGGYKLLPHGFVAFKGVIIGGTKTDGTVIANLPLLYRPKSARIMTMPLVSAGATGPNIQLRMSTSGNLTCFGISATATGNMGLDGVQYSILD